ncbi:MAG: hypothetical protein WB799_04960 [Candidatus Sulfotelmatobacter sp.]
MSRRFLYRRLGSAVIVILALFAVMVPRGWAQGRPQLKRPEDIPQEKPPEPKKKKVKGPRAVGLLQLTGSGKGTLVPVAILVDGKFYDASAYKADPVPMALESGTVYEVEQSGDSQGLFTVSGALHSKNQGSVNPWVGAGSYLPNGTEVAKTTRKAEDVPVGLDSSDSDAPPRLTRGNTAKPAATSNPSSAPTSGTPASTSSAGTGSSEKPAGPSAPPVASQPASGSSGGGSAGQDAQKPIVPAASDKPADQSVKQQTPAPAAGQTTAGQSSSEQTSQGQKSQAQASPGQASQGQAEDYYRPTLRRGKPTQAAPQDEETALKRGKPESPAMAAAAASAPAQLLPAISDAGGPDPRSYKFFWKTGEEEERRNQMLELAGDEVRAYANALARNRIPAKPPAAKAATAGHKAPAKPIQPVFEGVQFRAFDVWANNQIVMILTAEGHFPPAPGATGTPEQYSITVVTRTDIYGNLRKLYAGVTDKFHLDVTPRLELIDAVDADGDGRGELLFRETTDAGSGYVIYRATADKLWKMFDSLGES